MQQSAHQHVPMQTAGFAHPARNVNMLGIEPGMSVADFGAGAGAYVFAIATLMTNTGHLYAIDVQRDLLLRIHNEAARRGLKNVKIIWADLEKPHATKIAGGALDFVLISNLLFQLERRAVVLEEARRVLKPTGKLALIEWSDSFSGMGPQKKDVVTKEAGLELLRASGFALVDEFNAGAHHWGVRARVVPHV